MLKCWQHNANNRPKFSELAAILPEVRIYQSFGIDSSLSKNILTKRCTALSSILGRLM